MTLDDRSVTVVGLGNLGLAMASRLASEGWHVAGIDPSSDRRQRAERRGVRSVERPDLAGSRVLCLVVPDERAARAVLMEDGLLAELTPEHLIVTHSTMLPTEAQGLAADILEADGPQFLEAPVSGGAERAERGELTIFVAGDPDVIEQARPLLETEGNDIVEVGPVGAGAATKLANQLVMFAAHAALSEGLQLATSYGVTEEAVLKALSTATGDTWVGRNWGFFDRIAAEYNHANAPLASRPWAKDTAEILDAASAHGLDLPVARLIAESVPELIERHARAATGEVG